MEAHVSILLYLKFITSSFFCQSTPLKKGFNYTKKELPHLTEQSRLVLPVQLFLYYKPKVGPLGIVSACFANSANLASFIWSECFTVLCNLLTKLLLSLVRAFFLSTHSLRYASIADFYPGVQAERQEQTGL